MALLDQLVEISNYYGSDPDFVLAGGGNTSAKTENTLYIKPSGTTLAAIQKNDFVAMDRALVRKTLTKKYSTNPFKREDEIKVDLLDARLDYRPRTIGPRASVETALHELIDYVFVVHTHPNLINGLTCGRDGKRIAGELFGNEVLWIDYTDPGYTLAKFVEKKLEQYKRAHNNRHPKIILLQNHGLIVSGDTTADIRKTTVRLVRTLKEYIKKHTRRSGDTFQSTARRMTNRNAVHLALSSVAPALRGLLYSDIRPLISFSDDPLVMKVVTSRNGKNVVTRGTFSPDHMVYCKEYPVWIDFDETKDTEESLVKKAKDAVSAYQARHPFNPKVVFISGVGMLCIGDSYREAAIAGSLYKDFIKVAVNTAAFGGPKYLTPKQSGFIEEWEVESYRRQLIRSQLAGRAYNRVAIVTGAGQGIGEGIARGLAKEGAYIVVADINAKTARGVSESLNAEYGAGKSIAVEVDVTKADAVRNLVLETVKQYGGLDIVVSNAAILISGPTEQLTDDQLSAMTRTNYEGFFKVVRGTVGVMKREHQVNPDYTTDILLLSSKSGLQGSAANALYAGTKFGGIGFMQSFALEFVKDGVKVNAVCPGNFFEGPLWSDPNRGLFVQYLRAGKVPGAKTIEDVKRHYESRCPMGKGVALEDINKAIIYAIDQQYETGQAIPVTGGQVMLK